MVDDRIPSSLDISQQWCRFWLYPKFIFGVLAYYIWFFDINLVDSPEQKAHF
jgi:hypothetical protein